MNLVARTNRHDELPTTTNDDTERLTKSFRRQAVARKRVAGPMLFFQRIRYQYLLLKPVPKVVFAALGFWVFLSVLTSVWDGMFYRAGDGSPVVSKESSFAIAINTYKRPQMLQEAVEYYANYCGKSAGISQIFIIWAEQTPKVPTAESFFSTEVNKSEFLNRPAVHVLRKENDSLNARFEPIPQLKTTAVLMVDDDLRIDCSSLTSAFEAWKVHPDAMVGYYPRLVRPKLTKNTDGKTPYTYSSWPITFFRNRYNLVLTKAAFLHSKYLGLYTDDQSLPKAVKDYVHEHRNCEDIAMSMLVAHQTQSTFGKPLAPIFVEGQVSDRGLFNGISSGSGHYVERSQCLTDLTHLLKTEHGWKPPMDDSFPFRQNAWIQHSPGFPWQYKPALFFEWTTRDLLFGS